MKLGLRVVATDGEGGPRELGPKLAEVVQAAEATGSDEVVQAAEAAGFDAISVVDHAWQKSGLAPVPGCRLLHRAPYPHSSA